MSLAAVAALTCGLGGTVEGSNSGSARIVAIYKVNIGSFNLGNFQVTTTVRGDGYDVRGQGRFSILEGLIYSWNGTTTSRGRVTPDGPEPSMYAFSFTDGGKKGERLRVTFNDGAVQKVSITPRQRMHPQTIPVTREQLQGVLDPLSGAFLTAHSSNPNGDLNVCKRTLPVFDGRQRFDLVLSPKKAVMVHNKTRGAYAGPAVICRVKFIPISGYHPGDPGIRHLTQSNEIEVWLIPVKRTQMYVPYRIVLPTPVGYGTAVVTSIQVSGSRRASLD
jgi:hypothetical protein